jgi:hypothetical protein
MGSTERCTSTMTVLVQLFTHNGAPRRATPQPGPSNRVMMTEVSLDELAPVDFVVVEFPAGASSFTGSGRWVCMA